MQWTRQRFREGGRGATLPEEGGVVSITPKASRRAGLASDWRIAWVDGLGVALSSVVEPIEVRGKP